MLFQMPKQQCQSTEGINLKHKVINKQFCLTRFLPLALVNSPTSPRQLSNSLSFPVFRTTGSGESITYHGAPVSDVDVLEWHVRHDEWHKTITDATQQVHDKPTAVKNQLHKQHTPSCSSCCPYSHKHQYVIHTHAHLEETDQGTDFRKPPKIILRFA